MPVLAEADQGRPEGRPCGQVADRVAFLSAEPLDLLVVVAFVAVELDVPPGHHRLGGNDLHGLVELGAETGRQVGVPVDHRLHRLAQPGRVQRAGHGDPELHRVDVVAVVGAALGDAGMEQQTLLHRGQRQDVGQVVLLVELVELLLGQPGGQQV